MAGGYDSFRAKLGIGSPTLKGKGYNFAPFIQRQGQATPGQTILNKVGERKSTGQDIYSSNKQDSTNRLANDLVNKSAGLKFDEFGKPEINLTDFSGMLTNQIQSVDQRGKNALQTEQAKQAFRNAVNMQNIGSYGFSGYAGDTSGSDIPGASKNNPGAKALAIAMKAMKNGTPYVYGGNSLSQGVDCSGLVQQAYRQLGISLPRTTYEQAKFGKQVSLQNIRPGDLVFYNNYGHVGIYAGNGKIIHSANSRLGIITSNLTNSNGAPLMVLRPY